MAEEGGQRLSRFGAFYVEAYPDAVRLATLLVGVNDAEDTVQDAFVAVFRRFEAVDDPGAYLRATVVNGCRTLHRSVNRRDRRERRYASPEQLEPDHVEVFDVLARLTIDQRTVLVLRVWGGWPDTEIASVLGCRRSTVRSHAMRAMALLREELT